MRSRRTNRRIWVVAGISVIVLLATAGIVAWRLTNPATGSTTERTVEVTSRTIRQTVGGTGTVEPKRRADLSFASAGTVNSVQVGVGQHVVKGQRLARIDTASLKADLEAAKAD